MYNRKHKLPATFLIVCIIALIGFKDTGIFVREYVDLKNDGEQIVFEKAESVNVLKEIEGGYIVEKQGNSHQIPKEYMIRTTRSVQSYKVIRNTNITDKPNGRVIGLLNVDEIVQALRYEPGYGLFTTTDGVEGYVELSDLEVIVEDSISYGTSKVDQILKNDNLVYTLVKDEIVAIKDFKDNMYIVVDEKGNEFKANESYIEIRRIREKATRGNISRRSASVTKVVEAAYSALGMPYVGGDTGKRGYDCSGFTYSIYLNNLNIKLNRTSIDQGNNGVEVRKSDLIPGDLVFFRASGSGIGHVGIYIGDSNMIHASSSRKKVTISSIDEAYYKTRYVTSRRIIN